MLRPKKCNYDLLAFGAMSRLYRIEEKVKIVGSPCDNLEVGMIYLPDYKRWNFVSRFPALFRVLYGKDLKNLCDFLSTDLGCCEKAIVLIHKDSVLDPMMAIAGHLLKEEVFENNNFRVIILKSAKIPKSRLYRCLSRHGVPNGILSDAHDEASGKDYAEMHRLLKTK